MIAKLHISTAGTRTTLWCPALGKAVPSCSRHFVFGLRFGSLRPSSMMIFAIEGYIMIFLYQSMISTDLHNSTRDDHRDIQDLLLLQLHEKYSMLIHRCTRDPFSVLCAPWFWKPQRYVHNGSQCVSIYLSIYLYIYICVCVRARIRFWKAWVCTDHV